MRKTISMAMLLGIGIVAGASAVTSIDLVGDGDGYDETGEAAKGYRSTNIAKLHDLDGDNVYGSDGYFFFGIGSGANANQQPFSRNTQKGAGWVTNYAQGSNWSHVAEFSVYTPIDNPALMPGDDVGDWPRSALGVGINSNAAVGVWSEIMTFSIDSNSPPFRLGIMAGNEHTAGDPWDPTGLRLSVDGGAPIAVTSLPVLDATSVGMVFFDVVTDGTGGTFSVEGQQRQAGSGPTIAGLTFGSAGVITITAVGDGSGYDDPNQVDHLSVNVPKAFDSDGDNAYGTLGSIFAGNSAVANGANQAFTTRTHTDAAFVASLDQGADYRSIAHGFSFYGIIDDPGAGPGNSIANWSKRSGVFSTTKEAGHAGEWYEAVTFTIAPSAPQQFRVGLMAGNIDNDWQTTGLRLAEIGGASAQVVGLSVANGQPSWVFFDVDLNGSSCGTFSISVQKQNDADTGSGVGGVTFDFIPPAGTVFVVK